MTPIRAFHPASLSLAVACLSLLTACGGGGGGDGGATTTTTSTVDASATGATPTSSGSSTSSPSGSAVVPGAATGAASSSTSSTPSGTSTTPATSSGGAASSPASPAGASLTCDITHYAAGAVRVPTATELALYAGTYDGDEGVFGAKPGDPFIKSGTARLVLGTDLRFTYKDLAYTVTSVCIDKAPNGAGGTFLYVEAGPGLIDFTDAGTAHGFSPADTNILFQNGKKQ